MGGVGMGGVCGVKMPERSTEAEAIAAWNRRAGEAGDGVA